MLRSCPQRTYVQLLTEHEIRRLTGIDREVQKIIMSYELFILRRLTYDRKKYITFISLPLVYTPAIENLRTYLIRLHHYFPQAPAVRRTWNIQHGIPWRAHANVRKRVKIFNLNRASLHSNWLRRNVRLENRIPTPLRSIALNHQIWPLPLTVQMVVKTMVVNENKLRWSVLSDNQLLQSFRQEPYHKYFDDSAKPRREIPR